MQVTVASVQERMKQMLQPLKQDYDEIQSAIEETERQLAELRHTRDEIRKLIRVSEPDFGGDLRTLNGNGQRKAKKLGTAKGGHRYKPETIATMTEWFQSNAENFNEMNEGLGVYSSQLVKDTQPPTCKTQSAMSYLLAELHTRGVLRLNHVGGSGGKTRFFKVVV